MNIQPSGTSIPAVTVIIPHLKNRQMLEACLDSLAHTIFTDFVVLVVDNGGKDSDLCGIENDRSGITVLRLSANAGYAGGCNAGLRQAASAWVAFLNDDAIVEPDWLGSLVATAEADSSIGALQPKILSLSEKRCGRRMFDYAGGAGGLIDRLGYPYCLGRNFRGREEDSGQYDQPQEIFWASGVALFARRELLVQLGGFEERFFMHMEEIDFCWRMKLLGFKVRSVPQSVVWHQGGASLHEGSPAKVFCNHRNAMLTLFRNRSAAALAVILPFRLALELAAIIFYLARGGEGIAQAVQVVLAFVDLFRLLPETLRQRRTIQRMRVVSDHALFRGAPVSMLLLRRSSPHPLARASQ